MTFSRPRDVIANLSRNGLRPGSLWENVSLTPLSLSSSLTDELLFDVREGERKVRVCVRERVR